MQQFGYVSFYGLIKNPQLLKQGMLMFDSLVVDEPRYMAERLRFDVSLTNPGPQKISGNIESIFNDLLWLIQEGVIGVVHLVSVDERAHMGNYEIRWNNNRHSAQAFSVDELEEISIWTNAYGNQAAIDADYYAQRARDIFLRSFSVVMREKGVNAFSVYKDIIPGLDESIGEKQSVLFILLDNIPIPSDETSLEQLKDFLDDPDSKSKMVRLKDWVNDFTRMQLSTIELQEKLEYLIQEYREHMNLHRMKHQAGAFETVIKGTAEAMESFAKGEFSKIVSPIFAARHQQIAMLEAERSMKDNRIAYIVKTQDRFGQKH